MNRMGESEVGFPAKRLVMNGRFLTVADGQRREQGKITNSRPLLTGIGLSGSRPASDVHPGGFPGNPAVQRVLSRARRASAGAEGERIR